MSSSPAIVAELMSHFLFLPLHFLKWPRLRSLPAHLMVWTMGTTLAALLFVCGGENVQEVKANEEHALAFHQGGTSRGHTLADEDHSPLAALQRPGGEQSSQLLSDRVPALSKGSSEEQNEVRTPEDDVVAPAYFEHETLRPPLFEGAQFDTAEEFLQSNAEVQYASEGWSATRVGNEEQQERRQTRTPSTSPTNENDIEDLGRDFVDHKQQEWLQIGGYAAAKKRSRAADATAMGGPSEDLRLPMEQQIFQMQQEMAMLRAEMQQKIAMLEANATACMNNVTDLVSASTDIRHAGAVVEEASGLLLAQMFTVWWVDYTGAVVYLLSGFAALLIVVALPVRLVFFPREYSQQEEVESEGGGDVTPEPEQGATAVADGDQADLVSADRPKPPPAKPEKYWLLPWDFARKGTLSSVCQRGDSTEGKIFTTGLVIAEICALLSRYTLIVYDRSCAGFATVVDQELDSIGTERSIDLALRVVWLILPPLLMIITAAVPGNSFKVKGLDAAPTTTAGNAAGPGGSATRNRVTAIHEDDTRIWSQALHRSVLAAVGLRLIFETRQLFREPLDVSGVLFGVSDSLDLDEQHDLHFWVDLSDQRVAARCGSDAHRAAWAQAYRGYYLGRVVWLFLGWAFSLLFLALSLACALQYRHAEDRSAKDRDRLHAAAYLEDVRLVPQSASLILPRLSFAAEILAMLTVQALPFWPVLLKVMRHGQGATWNPPLTPLDVLLRVSFEHLSWRQNLSQCGHYFDTDKDCGNDMLTAQLWFSQPPVR
ncbi:unnamed protein product [Amoebophrya sp. A120]|nr:unnamed protein product [Amoebophrya sp. A120]|eukprot:GSA120T00009509001.1